jgi:hypothetical protein
MNDNPKEMIQISGIISKSVMREQSGKLIRQPAIFSQRVSYAYSSARSRLRGANPVLLRMASSPACLTFFKICYRNKDVYTHIEKLDKYGFIHYDIPRKSQIFWIGA